jgi:hypothetical protein
MIVRGPILLAGAVVGPDAETLGPFASSFLVDRAEVWEKLAEILLPHDAFKVIKAVKKTRNGRLVDQLLFRHYLGPNNVGNMAGEAEQMLALVQYKGEMRHWNFEKYALMHLRQHLILEALVIHGYTGIDAGSKVRYLLNGIWCAELDAVRTRIMSDKDLHQDFARCVTLFKDFVKQSAQVARAQLGIAAMTVTPGGGQAKGEDRWYSIDEWRALPKDEQATIREAPAARKKKGGGKNPSKGGPKKGGLQKFGSVKKLKDKIKNQKRQLAVVNGVRKNGEAADDVTMSEAGSDGDQRKHSALIHQKAAGKGADGKS